MKTYMIDEIDLALLSDISGGFNATRVGKPVTPRWDTSVNWAKADRLSKLVDDLKAADEEQPVPPVVAGSVINLGQLGFGATPWTMMGPGQVAFFQATVDGLVSCSASGGSFYCWGNVSATAPGAFPQDESVTQAGSGTAPRLAIKAGQFYTFKHDAPTAVSMHASIEGQP
jgi:hypothetical protein